MNTPLEYILVGIFVLLITVYLVMAVLGLRSLRRNWSMLDLIAVVVTVMSLLILTGFTVSCDRL